MNTFSLSIPTGINFGTINKIGSITEKYTGNALIITESILSDFGLPELIKDNLKRKKIESILFDEINPDSNSSTIEKIINLAQMSHARIIIGIGGVKLLSIAKTVSKLVPNKISLDNYLSSGDHFKRKLKKTLHYIEIPAAFRNPFSFTGIAYLIDARDRNPKLIDFGSLPDEILFDPDITGTIPDKYTSSILFDIFLNAVEGYFSDTATFLSDTYFLKAIKLIISSIITKITTPANENIRTLSSQAGFLTSMGLYLRKPGIGTRITYSINGIHKLSKSFISVIILPYILKYYSNHYPEKIKTLSETIANNLYFINDKNSSVVEKVRNFIASLQLPMRLSDYGIAIKNLERIVEGANSLDNKKFPVELLSNILKEAL